MRHPPDAATVRHPPVTRPPPHIRNSNLTENMLLAETDQLTDLQSRAESGDARSQYELGLRCETGEGAPRDPAAAARWFLQAASSGLAEAQLKAGLLSHRRGLGRSNGGPNEAMIEAYKWFKLAATHGGQNAKDRRDWAALQMKRAEVAEGNRRAEDFLAAHPPSACGSERQEI